VQACRDCARHCTAIARLDHLEILEMASQVPPDAGLAAPGRGN